LSDDFVCHFRRQACLQSCIECKAVVRCETESRWTSFGARKQTDVVRFWESASQNTDACFYAEHLVGQIDLVKLVNDQTIRSIVDRKTLHQVKDGKSLRGQ
jgi:hypothetical protein